MLYHVSSGFPFKMTLPPTLLVAYSKHAMEAAKNREVELDSVLSLSDAKLIEIETDEAGIPVKILVEKPYNEDLKVSYAIALRRPEKGKFIVKTVWLNDIDTMHKINPERYICAS